jgi:hypothetical protein
MDKTLIKFLKMLFNISIAIFVLFATPLAFESIICTLSDNVLAGIGAALGILADALVLVWFVTMGQAH